MHERGLRKIFTEFGGSLAAVVFFICVLTVLWYGLDNTRKASHAERVRLTEDAILRAVVSYYALEGSYPANFSELTDRYGLSVDDSLYVDYRIFASNMMPEITVLEVST